MVSKRKSFCTGTFNNNLFLACLNYLAWTLAHWASELSPYQGICLWRKPTVSDWQKFFQPGTGARTFNLLISVLFQGIPTVMLMLLELMHLRHFLLEELYVVLFLTLGLLQHLFNQLTPWDPSVSLKRVVTNISYYHLMQIFVPFHWPRTHHLTCK